MPSTFQPCKIDCRGTSLAVYVPTADIKAILQTFPEGRHEGYYEPEKGYYHDEVGFRCVETGEVFKVYARWGQVRIGALDPCSPRAQELAAWLASH